MASSAIFLAELPPKPAEVDERLGSSFRLEISLSIGYQRKRAAIEGKWEGRFITVLLLIAGIPLVLFVVFEIFVRLGQL